MRLTVTLEKRFIRTPDGAVWTQDSFDHAFWVRYLEVFDEVKPVARILGTGAVPADWRRADGPMVRFTPLPYYLGPFEYLRRSGAVRDAVRGAVERSEAVILRVPSQIAAIARPYLNGRPYGVEVVGDPHDVFGPGAVKHSLRPLFRMSFSRRLKKQCAGAAAAAYVTSRSLQFRYPACPAAFTTNYSSIELSETAVIEAARPVRKISPFTVIFVGTLAQLYKGPDVLLGAAALCVRSGLDLRVVIVGDGRYRSQMERLTRRLGLSSRVAFTGQLASGEAVRARLDQADLFVLPSRTEGLPRAMIEAMARGLPCIGSAVGGIPELLPPEDMVPPGNAVFLAEKIRDVLMDPSRRLRMAVRNLETAREYHSSRLQPKRRAFYRVVREHTEAWRQSGR